MKRKLVIYLFLLIGLCANAQETPKLVIEELDFPDSLISIAPDSLAMPAIPDSLALPADSLLTDTLQTEAKEKKPVLDATINYNAQDSIIVALDGKKVYMYKGGVVTYENIELTADYIILDLNTKEVYAEGLPDSTGVMQGNPIFKDGTDEFECKTLRYNFKSQKGIIQDVKTEQGEGYVHSERTKKVSKDAFILKNGKYTTCDADHPHFYLKMTKAKVISNKKIITGPAYMVLEDFPIYFPILPFGFFPNSPSYSSGIIIPSYGEENSRGFFLREGGYYWAASEYFDVTLKGDIYSKGSWGTYFSSNYRKRYKFNGSVNIKYNVNKYSEEGLPDYSRSPGFSIQWTHSQDSKANPYQTFSASVNMSTSSYDKQNSYNVYSYLNSQKSSSISYSKKWENSPFNMSVNFRHSQNSSDSTMTISFPEMTFSMSKIYPFKSKNHVGKTRFWEKISIGYTGNIKNSITAREDSILQMSLVKDWQNGWQHSIPITLPSFNLLKYINMSPSFTYKERWYTNEVQSKYIFNHVTGEEMILKDTIYGFKRNYEYSYSLSASTNIYGMYLIKNPNSRIKAIRHKMTPTMSFSYRPDFGDPKYGFWDSYVDAKGKIKYFNRFQNGVFGSTSRGESGAISFGLSNNIEAKMAARTDTISSTNTEGGEKSDDKYTKVKILENLSFSGSYNLVADSLNLSNIAIRGRTTIKGISINFGGTLNPYLTDTTGDVTINQYAWNHRSGLAKLGRLTNANLSFGLSFKSKDKKGGNKGGTGGGQPGQGPQSSGQPDTGFDEFGQPLPVLMMTGPQYYDFSIPWEFRMDYTMSYSKSNPFESATINQSVNFNGRLSLTDKWNMTMTTNFDIQAKEFSFTTFNISRSLHCWSMSFNFVPFGDRKSYSFSLNASSSMLKDLKIDKNKSWYDN
ncbi:putative LPS assembly protein LptD [Mangrovibacterium diazotrophicum]|uniref:putative LPS assembly protein LptD n=1 Tax=Mangrovibacterium diazotrophicum TaxID=1261403 RepID=UPI0011C35888|nr:putative LPS assembly protein LptD [Mangrovibacterium diazotrophicum]